MLKLHFGVMQVYLEENLEAGPFSTSVRNTSAQLNGQSKPLAGFARIPCRRWLLPLGRSSITSEGSVEVTGWCLRLRE